MNENKIYLIAVLAIVVLLVASGCNRTTGQTVLDKNVKDTVQTKPIADSASNSATSTKVACGSDLDCGKPMIGETYCFQGNSLTPQNIPKCEYAGTINSKCIVEQKDKMVLCNKERETCKSGACVLISSLPCTDTDGGKDENDAGIVTDGLGKEYVDMCVENDDRFVYERYCSHGKFGEGLTETMWCEGKCTNGECVGTD
jgi:hypothetical protein